MNNSRFSELITQFNSAVDLGIQSGITFIPTNITTYSTELSIAHIRLIDIRLSDNSFCWQTKRVSFFKYVYQICRWRDIEIYYIMMRFSTILFYQTCKTVQIISSKNLAISNYLLYIDRATWSMFRVFLVTYPCLYEHCPYTLNTYSRFTISFFINLA